MREIKFRAWLPTLNKMTYSGTIEQIVRWAPLGCTPVWLQFTGLYDDSGKEIYEGDILKIRNGTRYNYNVVFENGSFVLYHWNGDLDWDGSPGRWGLLSRVAELKCEIEINLQVIGSVYDTPKP